VAVRPVAAAAARPVAAVAAQSVAAVAAQSVAARSVVAQTVARSVARSAVVAHLGDIAVCAKAHDRRRENCIHDSIADFPKVAFGSN
jgi:hypothetical protein